MSIFHKVCAVSLLFAASLTAQQMEKQEVVVAPGDVKTAGFAAKNPGITFQLDVKAEGKHKFVTDDDDGILGENRDSTLWRLDKDTESLKTYKVLVNRIDDGHEAVFKMRFKNPKVAGGGGGVRPTDPPPAYVKAVNCFVKIYTPGTIAAPGTLIPSPSVAGKPYTGILQPNADDEINAGVEDHTTAAKTGDGLTKDNDLVKVELSWNPWTLRPDMVEGKVLQLILPTNTKAYLASGAALTDMTVTIGAGASGQLAALGGSARKQNIFIEGNAAWATNGGARELSLLFNDPNGNKDLDYPGAEAKALLLPVEIVPSAGQVGKTGDKVPSNKAVAGQKHYVSPKKTIEISDDYVVLKAEGIEKELFDALLDWDCVPAANGSVVPNDTMSFRIKRDAPAKTTVKIRTKSTGTEVDLMNVWVVWAEGAKVGDHPITTSTVQIQTGDGTIGPGIKISGGYNFKFTIQPQTICTEESDRPDLAGANTYEGNVINPPGSGTLHDTSNIDIKGGADSKWDVSRRVRAKILNPHLYPKSKLDKVLGTLWNNQPRAEDIPVSYPTDIRIGNDDTETLGDEENNPYKEFDFPIVAHGVGEIASSDKPGSPMRHSTGSDGDVFEERLHFGEFTRLLVGDKWYRISEMFDWRAHMKFKRVAGSWENDGTSFATDNTGY